MDASPRPDLRYSGVFAGVDVRSSRPLAELPVSDGRAREVIEVVWVDTLPRGHADWFHAWTDGPGVWARFGAVADGYLVDFPALAGFHISADGGRVLVALAPDVPELTGRHLLLNQVLPVALSRRGHFVLHAGAWAWRGQATACLGPTGSGKSTLVAACARRGAEVVTDDSLIVRRVGTSWEAVPGYPMLRLWASGLAHVGWPAGPGTSVAHYSDKQAVPLGSVAARFADGPRPLSRLVLLGEGGDRRPTAVSVYAQVFRLDVRDIAESTRLFHLVADLIGDLGVVRVDEGIDDRRAADLAGRLCDDAGCTTQDPSGIVRRRS